MKVCAIPTHNSMLLLVCTVLFNHNWLNIGKGIFLPHLIGHLGHGNKTYSVHCPYLIHLTTACTLSGRLGEVLYIRYLH